jgi:hypothetical protein
MVVLQLVPFLLMLALYAAYLKAAGRVLKYRGISWRRCFGLALVVGVVTIAVRAAIVFGHVAIPPLVGVLLGLAMHIGLGAYTFRSHGSTASGDSLQPYHGGLLAAVAVGFMLATALVIFGVLRVLQH